MTQQVTIELIGGRVQTYPPAKPTTPTITPTITAKVPTTVASAVVPSEPATYRNPVLAELQLLYDELTRRPAGHPGHRLKLERWRTLERKVRGVAP